MVQRPKEEDPSGKRSALPDRDPKSGKRSAQHAQRAEMGGPALPDRDPKSWEEQLERLKGRVRSSPKAKQLLRSALSATDQQLRHFEVNVQESRLRDQLVIDFLSQERRSDGTFGKPRPLSISEADLSRIDEEERRVFALLLGNAPENRGRGVLDRSASYARSVVRSGIDELVLPLLCKTERLFLSGQTADQPLRFDEGPCFSWEIEVRTEGEHSRLWGRLMREGETIDLKEPQLLLSSGWIFFADRVARLDTQSSFDAIDRLQRYGPIDVPVEERDALLTRLATLPGLPALSLPEDFGWTETTVHPRPRVEFFSRPDGVTVGQLAFDYAGQVVPFASRQTTVADQVDRRLIRRNEKDERAALKELASLKHLTPATKHHKGEVQLPTVMLTKVMLALVSSGWHVETDGLAIRGPGLFQVRVTSAIDWFDLSGEVDYDGVMLPLPEILKAVANDAPFVELPDGTRGVLPPWAKRYAALLETGKVTEERVRFAPAQSGIVRALLGEPEEVSIDVKFERLQERLKDLEKRRACAAPDTFQGTLRTYQEEGLGWMTLLESCQLGGCLADDMGLGKTIQVLALLLRRHRRAKNRTRPAPSLIVVPKSLVHNWKEEAARFAPQLSVLDYTGKDRSNDSFDQQDLIITTYGTLRRDVLQFLDTRFESVVIDEAQAIKNPDSQAAKACRMLRSNHRLALSGTPVENNLKEIWSVFEFLNPGMLGSKADFAARAKEADERFVALLAAALRPFMLRRTKSEVLTELPEKTEQTLYVELTKSERQNYDEMRKYYRASLGDTIKEVGFSRAKIHVLEALLRLRQAACHPGLIDAARRQESSAKLDILAAQLESVVASGHKALVFSQFTSLLALVRRRLDALGIRYSYLDGKTRDRQQAVNAFVSDLSCGVFLISLKAGGYGLNLTASDYVFILDPWWNPAVEAQAIDRAHRLGQRRPVFAYRLIARDTVEEKIVALQGEKKRLADAIMSADRSLLGDLTDADLELLLS